MKVSLLAVLTLSLALAPALPASARHVRHHYAHHAAGGSWEGRWAGAWGGSDPSAVIVKGNRVVAFEYGGQTTPVPSSHVTARKIVYGTENIVTLTRTGANTAHGTIHTSRGDGAAEFTRQ